MRTLLFSVVLEGFSVFNSSTNETDIPINKSERTGDLSDQADPLTLHKCNHEWLNPYDWTQLRWFANVQPAEFPSCGRMAMLVRIVAYGQDTRQDWLQRLPKELATGD